MYTELPEWEKRKWHWNSSNEDSPENTSFLMKLFYLVLPKYNGFKKALLIIFIVICIIMIASYSKSKKKSRKIK